jgi:hypothetical protein
LTRATQLKAFNDFIITPFFEVMARFVPAPILDPRSSIPPANLIADRQKMRSREIFRCRSVVASRRIGVTDVRPCFGTRIANVAALSAGITRWRYDDRVRLP